MIPQASIDFIVDQETGGRGYYTARASKPIWPGGESGVTIGVGYDLGQQTAAGFGATWSGQLSADVVSRLSTAIGVRGQSCQALAQGFSDIVIPFDDAVAVFTASILPSYVQETLATFPGLDALNGLCIGAMVSLVYNRGPGLVGDSRTEMMTIHNLIAAGTPQGVPDQFRAMKRLWPNSTGLCNRRDAEAAMFQQGLDAMAGAAPAVA